MSLSIRVSGVFYVYSWVAPGGPNQALSHKTGLQGCRPIKKHHSGRVPGGGEICREFEGNSVGYPSGPMLTSGLNSVGYPF